MPERRSEIVPPVVLAMLIAHDAHRNPATGKFCIHGTFDIINAATFPCRHAAIAVYLSLTGGHGTVPLTLRLLDVDETRQPVFAVTSAIHFTDPTAWVETASAFRGVTFPEPGEYRLQCCAAGELLRELRLKLRVVPESDKTGL